MPFAHGNCLMTINFGAQWKNNKASWCNSTVIGKIGVSMVPGSTQVLDRNSGELAPCTTSLCPHATFEDNGQGHHLLVNRAPYASYGGIAVGVSAVMEPVYQRIAFDLFAYLAKPEQSFKMLLADDTPFAPVRSKQLVSLDPYVAAGYNADDTAMFLAAHGKALRSPNAVLDLRISSGLNYRLALDQASINATAGGNIARIMAAADAMVTALVRQKSGLSPQQLLHQYRECIGWTALRTDAEAANDFQLAQVLSAILAVAVCCILAAGVLLWVRHAHKHNRNIFGALVPPGAGPSTTLCVTDIEASTPLWEQASAADMHAALKLHNATVRSALAKHRGYESATEGDSFILAFHSPEDAVLCCMDIQKALLQAPWPQQLLDIKACAPVYTNMPIGEEGPWNPPKLELEHQPSSVLSSALSGAAELPDASALAFRGLRVRIGLHTGIHDASTIKRGVAGRTVYVGPGLAMAKAVGDAAHGGMVLMSEATFTALPLSRIAPACLAYHAGTHMLKERASPEDAGHAADEVDALVEPINLYEGLPVELTGRLALMPPIRSFRKLGLGAMEAPAGNVTIAFMNIVGVATLLSWNHDVATEALALFHQHADDMLEQHKGYMVECLDGLYLAAFSEPANAVLWALDCHQGALDLDWPRALMHHELCEELVVHQPTVADKTSSVLHDVLLFRGLRLKTGMDSGPAGGEISTTTGRMLYRGKVMNRAARISARTATGQVYCTAAMWAASLMAPTIGQRGVTAASLGMHNLKGVTGKMELVECRAPTQLRAPMSRNGSSGETSQRTCSENELTYSSGELPGPSGSQARLRNASSESFCRLHHAAEVVQAVRRRTKSIEMYVCAEGPGGGGPVVPPSEFPGCEPRKPRLRSSSWRKRMAPGSSSRSGTMAGGTNDKRPEAPPQRVPAQLDAIGANLEPIGELHGGPVTDKAAALPATPHGTE